MSEELAEDGVSAAETGESAAFSGDWLGSLPDDLRGLAEVKGWQGAEDVLKGYLNLEGLVEADKAGRSLVLPRDAEDREAFETIYKALGRPDEAGGYELGKLLEGEAVNEDFMGQMGQAMHEAGLSKAQAEKMAQAWQRHYNSVIDQARADNQAQVKEVHASYSPAEVEIARRGLMAIGGSEETARAIEETLGYKLAAQIGKNVGTMLGLGEDKAIDGAAGQALGSAAGAKRRIAEKQADPLFLKRYLDGEPQAVAQMTDLYRRASEDTNNN